MARWEEIFKMVVLIVMFYGIWNGFICKDVISEIWYFNYLDFGNKLSADAFCECAGRERGKYSPKAIEEIKLKLKIYYAWASKIN